VTGQCASKLGFEPRTSHIWNRSTTNSKSITVSLHGQNMCLNFQLTRGVDFLRHQNPGVKQNQGDLLVPYSPAKLKAGFLRKMILCYTHTHTRTRARTRARTHARTRTHAHSRAHMHTPFNFINPNKPLGLGYETCLQGLTNTIRLTLVNTHSHTKFKTLK
jgi:hypothetical protein